MREINQKELEDLIKNDLNTTKDTAFVVDFYASWCGPCKTLAATLEKVAEENPNVYKLNVEENDEAVVAFGIRAMPTLIYFKNGSQIAKTTGIKTKEEILANLAL